MRFDSLDSFLTAGRGALAKGPVGLILVEDAVEVDTTIRHHLDLGFRKLIVLANPEVPMASGLGDRVIRVDHDMLAEGALCHVVNEVIRVSPGL